MASVFCTQCGQQNAEDAKFCARCGAALTAPGARADPSRAALVQRVLSGIPMGRMGEPPEIVGPVLFLASDAASMVTGVLLPGVTLTTIPPAG